MGLVEHIKDGDWRSVRSAIAKLSSIKLGPTSEPTFAGIKFTGLTASRLVASDANKALVSSALIDWVTGTANRVTVSADDDPAGGIVLTGPQDIDATASPIFAKVLVSNGAVGAPGFAFADDTDTGIYVHEDGGGHQRIAFSCDGVKAFEITDYDGIELKDVDSAYYAEVRFTGTAMTNNRQLNIDMNNAARTLNLTGNATLNQDVSTVGDPIFAAAIITGSLTVDTSSLFVNSTNNRVGFGTLTSIAGVEIKTGSSEFFGTAYPSLLLRTGTIDGTDAYLSFFAVAAASGSVIMFDEDHPLRIGKGGGADDPDDAFAEYIRILTNGNVGIGTNAPNAPLEVKGAKPGVVGGHQSGQLQVTGTGGEFYCAVITGHNSFNGNTQLWYLGNTSSSSHNDIAFINRQNAPIHFYTNNASRVTIDAAGNVGIGETAPQDKLEVNGTVLVKNKLKFTQDDGLEFIDSLADGYMDYGATTGHRFNNDIIFTTTKGIRLNTSDGSDNQGIFLAGGGAFGNTRGACIVCYGNEVGEAPGKLYLYGGNVTDGDIIFNVENAERGRFRAEGLLVTGAIASGTATITASSDVTNVSGINTLFINPAGAVVIGGFVGGVDGQVLFVSAIANGQDITLEHAEGIGGATQDVYLHSGLDETLSTEYGGWTLTCDGTNWYDTSHAKHV